MPELRKKPALVNRTAGTNGTDKIAPQLTGLAVSLASLTLDPNNARVHPETSIEVIKKSLSTFGQMKPIVVRKSSRIVVAGNGTVQAARELGWTKIAANVVDLTDVEAISYGLADNKTAEESYFDMEIVARHERLIGEQNMIGWTAAEIAVLRVQNFEPQTDPDDAPEAPEEPLTKVGDIWTLGDHRLMCGDSTDAKNLKKLMAGGKASLVFTDPPYGVAIAAKNRFLDSAIPIEDGKLRGPRTSGRVTVDIEDDHLTPEDLKAKLLPAFVNLRTTAMADDCTVFMTAPQGGELGMMMMMMKDAGLPIRHVLIWKKNAPTFSMGRLDYDYQHEPILMTWLKRHKRPMLGTHKTSVWEIDKPRASASHPTMKPVELVVNAIENNSDKLDVVADIYLGSGTTLIAAQQTHRKGRGMEVDPRYCDVTLQRWADFTGLDPVRADGVTWSQLKKKKARKE